MKLTIDIWARLSKEQQERLQRIIARAVPSHERTMSEFFLPRSPVNQARIEKLTQQWQKAITNDAPEKFDIYLQTQNLTHNAQIKTSVSQSTVINQNYFPAKFVEVLIKNPQELPEWANALVELISLAILPEEQVKQSDNISDNQQIPYHQVIEPFLQGAKLTLQQCIATSGLTVSAAGLTDMLAVFANRLWHLVGSVVDFELHLLAANTGLLNNLGAKSQPILDSDVTSWLDRFERFPVLAYLVAVSYMNWRGWMTEICQRLAADRELLCTQLFRGMQLGQLTGFQGDAGDVHAQGRTVAILTFASGNKVVYKPKDLRCAAAFINLVTDLNQSGLEPQLHVRRILTRGNYTWEEFVEYKPCQNSQEVQRFYTRMGMTIRLLQLLEGRDFWLDNLVAHGEYPVFIDLETILQPRPTPTNLLPAEQVARQMLAESVVETCIIAMPTPIEMGIKAEDFGALAMPGEFITPYKRPTASRHNGNRPNEQDYFTWSHTQHAPVLDNNPVDAAEYLQEILAGYKLMQECLQTNQTALLAADSPLVYLSNVPVRFIYRDTWTYHKLIRSSLTPTLLVDPIQREIFFQQLLGPVFTQELETESRNKHCQIVESEIAALLRLDIPFFTSSPNSNAVFTLEGKEVAGYFDDTSWNCLQQRLHCLNKFPLEQQMDLIRSCFATSRPHVDLLVTERNMKSAVVENSWISEAIALGSSILADSVTSSANDLAWLGLVYHPHMDLLSLEVLQSDLLTGTCGLAILFCDLYTITGQVSWKDAARGALAATIKSVNHISDAWQEPEWSDRIQRNPYCGAFLGVGAQIFCLRYCAQALTAPELDKIANTCIQNLPLETLITHPSCDFVSGLSGLMLSVLSSTEGLEIGIKLITHLLDIRTKNGELPPPLYPHPSLWMNSFPDATAVLTMGLAKLLKHEHRMAPRFQHELESLLYAQLQNYPGVRHSPGHLLANLDIIQSTRIDAEQVLRKIDEYLAVERLATDTVGLLDDLEVAITAFQVTGKDKYLQHAFSSAEQIKTIRESYGSWFPRSFAADRHNLSVVWGVTAIARAFLRLHSPSVFTSIRIVGNPNFS